MGQKPKSVIKVLVGNIPVEITEDMIRRFFESTSGAVLKIDLPLNARTKNHMGYAIAEFGSLDDATRAVEELKGREISGRTISCSVIEAPLPPRKWYQRKS